MNFSILPWFHLMFGNHTNLFFHAVIVGNWNVKKVERQSARACFTWDISISPEHYPMHATQLLLTGQVCPMPMSSVPHAWGTLDRKSTLFKLIAIFFLKGVVFMFWHDIVYIELFYCVTNFELVWTWRVAVVENAKKCRLYPTFPYISYSWQVASYFYFGSLGWGKWRTRRYICSSRVRLNLWNWLRVKERNEIISKSKFQKMFWLEFANRWWEVTRQFVWLDHTSSLDSYSKKIHKTLTRRACDSTREPTNMIRPHHCWQATQQSITLHYYPIYSVTVLTETFFNVKTSVGFPGETKNNSQ